MDYDKEYKIRSILEESATQYLIDWEDDFQSEQKYEPTWEPKEFANDLARQDWEKQKALNKRLLTGPLTF